MKKQKSSLEADTHSSASPNNIGDDRTSMNNLYNLPPGTDYKKLYQEKIKAHEKKKGKEISEKGKPNTSNRHRLSLRPKL